MEVEQIRKQLQELNPQLGDVIEFYWVGAATAQVQPKATQKEPLLPTL